MDHDPEEAAAAQDSASESDSRLSEDYCEGYEEERTNTLNPSQILEKVAECQSRGLFWFGNGRSQPHP